MLSRLVKVLNILKKKDVLRIIVLLFAMAVVAIFQVLGVVSVLPFIALVMDTSIVYDNEWLLSIYELFSFQSEKTFLVFVGIVMLCLIVLSNASLAFTTWLKIKFAYQSNYKISKRLMQIYLSMPYEFYLGTNSSELSSIILSQVNQLTNNFIIPLINIISKSLMIIVLVVMLLWVNVYITIGSFIIMGGFYSIVYFRINRQIELNSINIYKATHLSFKAISEAFGGIKEIKVLRREKYFINKYSKESSKIAQYISWNEVVSQLPRFALEVIAFGGIILFVIILLYTQDNIQHVIPLAGLFAVAGYKLMPAIQDIFTSFTLIKCSFVVIDKIYHDITAAGSQEDVLAYSTNTELNFKSTRYDIRLENVSYTYPNTEKPVLHNLSIFIKQNTTVAFVGETGVGKTTLLDIILGLLIPLKGRIFLGDVVINKENLKYLQDSIGYVPQNIYLCDDTINKNIAFGVEEDLINYYSIERASKMANIHNFIKEELKDGYNTVIGERGLRLSGGQRQRIGIARALYHDPNILIFDEATNALDSTTESEVFKELSNLSATKTLIIVTHRLTTIKNCASIVMLDKGNVLSQGNYGELMKSNAMFRKMVNDSNNNFINV